MRPEKRPIVDAEDEDQPSPKKQRIPDALRNFVRNNGTLKNKCSCGHCCHDLQFYRVYMQAFLVEYFHRLLVPALEPILERLLRKIVREEMQEILTTQGIVKPGVCLPQKQVQVSDARKLQLRFVTRLPDRTFTRRKLKGTRDDDIEIKLIDATAGNLISSGPESCLQLDIVALHGEFDFSPSADWTPEHFERHLAKEREGKGPLLTGDLKVNLKNGIATLGELCFTDNSKWTRSDRFRLGVRVAPGHPEHIFIREAVSDAFIVRENRGEFYEKHAEPHSTDEVWRLKGIAKDGPLHRALTKEKIFTVEDFKRHLVMHPESLHNKIGKKSKKQWKSIVDNSNRCIPRKKIYTYLDCGSGWTAVFNSIYEVLGLLTTEGLYKSMELLSENEKVHLDSIKFSAYQNHSSFVEHDERVFWPTHQGRTNEASSIGVEPSTRIAQCDDDYLNVLLEDQTGIPSISELLDRMPSTETEMPEESTAFAVSVGQIVRIVDSDIIVDSDLSALNQRGHCSSSPGEIQLGNSCWMNDFLLDFPSEEVRVSFEECSPPCFHLDANDSEAYVGSLIVEETGITMPPISKSCFTHPQDTLNDCDQSISGDLRSHSSSPGEVLLGSSWPSNVMTTTPPGGTVTMEDVSQTPNSAGVRRSSSDLPGTHLSNGFPRSSHWNSERPPAGWPKLKIVLRVTVLFRKASSTTSRVPVVVQG